MELNGLVIAFNVSDFEIDSDGWKEGFMEEVIRESEENVGFSNGGVSDEEYFE